MEGDTSNPTQMIHNPHMEEDTSNPTQIIHNPHMGGDTSNPTHIIQHPHIGGDTSNPKILNQVTREKLPTWQGGDISNPPHLEIDNLVEALNKATQQISNEEDEVLKQLQKTQANISLWGLLMASYKHRQNQMDLFNQI